MSTLSHRLEILRETPDWVAVAKPAGLATIPGRVEVDSVLQSLGVQLGLLSAGSVDPRIRVVHRLDKETSGVLVMAKCVAGQRHLSHQFQNNTIEKEYLALVAGEPTEEAGEVDAPLARHVSDPKRMSVVKHAGRPARTFWKVEQRFRAFTLLRVFPKTGKTHQIRVHLKHIGLPLAIDPLYNRKPPNAPVGIFLSQIKRGYRAKHGEEERPLVDRLTLHAERLAFDDLHGQRVRIECTVPKDLRSLIVQLGKNSGR